MCRRPARGAEGATPLRAAAEGAQGWKDCEPPRDAMLPIRVTSAGHLAVVEALLRAGADRGARDHRRRTALALADSNRFTAVAARLRAP
jgi:hypothetical protein